MVELFDAAMDDVGLTEQPLRGVLHDYFAWSTDRMGLHPDSPDSVADDALAPALGLGRARHPLTRGQLGQLGPGCPASVTGRRCRSRRRRAGRRSPSP